GVTSVLIGTGAGTWLMNRALEQAWSRPIHRLWLHTCSHDHPGALAFYFRSGVRPFRQQLEIGPDPRLAGIVRRSAGKRIPVIECWSRNQRESDDRHRPTRLTLSPPRRQRNAALRPSPIPPPQ